MVLNTLSSSRKKAIYIFRVLNAIWLVARILKIERIVKKLVLPIVRGYQLYISPRKGFCCAYKKLHNGQSCSAYFYSCISDRNLNLNTASDLLQQRLLDCKQAYLTLQTNANYRQQHKAKKRRKHNSECGSCSEWIDFSPFLSGCDCGVCSMVLIAIWESAISNSRANGYPSWQQSTFVANSINMPVAILS